jgi:hypothetical protein
MHNRVHNDRTKWNRGRVEQSEGGTESEGYSLLEPLDVDLERLDRLVASAVVDSDADGGGLLAADASLLELLKSESTPVLDLCVCVCVCVCVRALQE